MEKLDTDYKREVAFKLFNAAVLEELKSKGFVTDKSTKIEISQNRIGIFLVDGWNKKVFGSTVEVFRNIRSKDGYDIHLCVAGSGNFTPKDIAEVFKFNLTNNILNDFDTAHYIFEDAFVSYNLMLDELDKI